MNKTLIEVYLLKRYRSQSEESEEKDLEEIVLGDAEVRNKERERYLSDKFERHLNKIIAKT
jgi:hypothetical protein